MLFTQICLVTSETMEHSSQTILTKPLESSEYYSLMSPSFLTGMIIIITCFVLLILFVIIIKIRECIQKNRLKRVYSYYFDA